MRVRSGVARRRSKKRLFKEARGNRGGRSKLLRTVKETVVRSRAFAYRDRRTKKRMMRRLWIIRISAACKQYDVRYSVFIHALKAASIGLDRKSLSELAIHHPEVFREIIESVCETATEQPANSN